MTTPTRLIVVDVSPPDPYSCEGLEMFKPLPDGRVWAAVAKSVTREQSSAVQAGRMPELELDSHEIPLDFISYCNVPLRTTDFEWTESPISRQLGVPLKWAPFSYQSDNKPNPGVLELFFDGDPESPTFARWAAKPPRGNVAVIRVDGQPFDDGQLSCLTEYLNKQIVFTTAADYRKAQTKEERERCKQALMRKLTPEAFHSYYVEFQRRIVAEDRGGIDDYLKSLRRFGHDPLKLRSPVEVTLGPGVAPACGSCGNIFGEDGKGLLACSRCKIRRYCGADCQKEDWKVHKIVCGGKKVKQNPFNGLQFDSRCL